MSLLNILHYPDPRLRTKAKPVASFGPEIEKFAADLLATMYDAPGIGLAATQVNVHKRIIAVDVSEQGNEPHIFVNPELTTSGARIDTEEGCLSVPGFYEPVSRFERVSVNAYKPDGTPFALEAEGLLAVCIQHECDHLEGKLFVDYLSGLKKNRIRKKLLKQQKANPPVSKQKRA
ncbi:MAG: peptide deformylase [Pseudomonadales bacterium]